MKWSTFRKNRLVQFFASLKLAVITIFSLTALMIWGTLAESAYGTTYAKWQVYFSPFFIVVEVFLFINILFAALVRFPYKKKLTGFYIIHLGLLLLLVSSAVTAVYGVDGSIQLLPNEKTNTVFLSEPTFYVLYEKNSFQKEFTETLPKTVSEKTESFLFLDIPTHKIYIDHFIPFAVPNNKWKNHDDPNKKSLFVSLNLTNPNVSQNLNLSDESLSSAFKKMGPLSLQILKNISPECLEKALEDTKANYVFSQGPICHLINDLSDKTLTDEGFSFKIDQSDVFFKVSVKTPSKLNYNFYPQISSLPITKEIAVDASANAALVSLKSYRQSPHIFLFTNKKMLFGKEDSWNQKSFEVQEDIALPWMGLKISIQQWIRNKQSYTEWHYKKPSQKNKDTDRFQAAKITVIAKDSSQETKTLWIDDMASKSLRFKNGAELSFILGKKIENLPFAFELDRFKMDKNPGTNDPASYESFVNVYDLSSQKQEKAHVYMNHPLKKDKYTFYQASYFPLKDKPGFGSVFSVNYDPGRAGKYLGSALLVFGAILHYTIRSRKKK